MIAKDCCCSALWLRLRGLQSIIKVVKDWRFLHFLSFVDNEEAFTAFVKTTGLAGKHSLRSCRDASAGYHHKPAEQHRALGADVRFGKLPE